MSENVQIIEQQTVSPAQTALENALQTTPSAVGVKPKSDAKSLLSAGQRQTLDGITKEVFSVVTGFQEARREEGRIVHARIIRSLAQGLKLVEGVDGRVDAITWVRSVFNPFVDVDKTPETHQFTTVQVYKTKTMVEAKAQTNPGYRQYFTRWVDQALWEAGIFKPANPKTGFPGENVPTLGVMVHGRTYMLPSEALADGNTLTDVHQAWKNIVRPNIEVIDHLPSKNARKVLFQAAAQQADEVSIVMREPRQVGDQKRMQKVRKYAEELPEAALIGIISGLVGIAAKRGMPLSTIFEKATAYANEADAAETDSE